MINQYGAPISTIDKGAFATYLADLAGRYGPGGTFWRGRDDGHLAAVYFEPFNEPWGWWFVADTVEPAHYADLFVRCARAVRARNPRAKCLIAGIDSYWTRRTGGGWADWFGPIFDAEPGIGAWIDGVTVHLYGTRPLDLGFVNNAEWRQVEVIAADLAARGLAIGGRVKLWVTEFGFSTVSNTVAPDYGVSLADQASQSMQALRIMHGRWADLLAGYVLFRYRDGVRDDREGRFGIVHNDNTPKPAYLALAAWIAAFGELEFEQSPQLGGDLYRSLGPFASEDLDPDGVLLHICEAITRMGRAVEDLVFTDEQGNPGWSALFDIDRCPGRDDEIDGLPFLGQLAGVRGITNLPDAQRRAAIREREGYHRGRPRAIISYAESLTDGTAGAVELRERYNPQLGTGIDAPYRGRLRIRRAHLAAGVDEALEIQRLKQRIPGGLVYEVVITDQRTWGDLRAEYADWGEIADENRNWGDMETFD